jgi:CubicO group peptidase (beta-lactamase class C family)
LYSEITIFHLLTHTSGVVADPGYFGETNPDNKFWEYFDSKHWINELLSGPLQSQPGKAWSYSSFGYTLLGEIIKRVSGISYKYFIRNNILEPLQLKNTWLGDMPENLINRICFVSSDEEKMYMKYYRTENPLFASGGIDSTLEDLCRLGGMFLNKGTVNGARILSRKSVESMCRNHMTGQPAMFWGADLSSRIFGLGLNITGDDLTTPGTFGHDGGGRSYLYCDASEQFTAAWFVPSQDESTWEPLSGVRSIIWSGLL